MHGVGGTALQRRPFRAPRALLLEGSSVVYQFIGNALDLRPPCLTSRPCLSLNLIYNGARDRRRDKRPVSSAYTVYILQWDTDICITGQILASEGFKHQNPMTDYILAILRFFY